jgi:hypothetical protein
MTYNPVVRATVDAPPDDLNRVSTQELTADVVVDTALVGQEVLIHVKGGGDRAIGGDIRHGSAHTVEVVTRGCKVLVLGPRTGITRVGARVRARWGVVLIGWAHWVLACLMVRALWEYIVGACSSEGISVITARYHTMLLEVGPRLLGDATARSKDC